MKSKKYLCQLFSVLVFLLFCSVSQVEGRSYKNSVSGWVLDNDTELQLGGVTVIARHGEGGNIGDIVGTYITSNDGYFFISGNGVYMFYLEFIKDGYSTYSIFSLGRWRSPNAIWLSKTLVVSFLDAKDHSREVIGAAADGVSKVVIQISNLPPDLTDVKKVKIVVPDGDGHLKKINGKDDAKIVNGVFTQTYIAPEYFVRENHIAEDRLQGKREIGLQITVNEQNVAHDSFFLEKPPVVLLHGL